MPAFPWNEAWRVTVSEQERYEFDIRTLTSTEGIALKGVGWTRIRLADGLNNDDPEAWQALVWLLRRRAGEPDLVFSDVEFTYGTCWITAVKDVPPDAPPAKKVAKPAKAAPSPTEASRST